MHQFSLVVNPSYNEMLSIYGILHSHGKYLNICKCGCAIVTRSDVKGNCPVCNAESNHKDLDRIAQLDGTVQELEDSCIKLSKTCNDYEKISQMDREKLRLEEALTKELREIIRVMAKAIIV